MNISDLLHRALRHEWLTPEEGVFLFENATTAELMYVGNAMRYQHVPGNTVTWIIDRNSNTTNVCIANCKFCNFYRRPGHEESYVTSIEEYKQKIEETFRFGGEQLLLHTEMSVKEIAVQCGFGNPRQFSRIWLKAKGKTPGAFRNKTAKG